MTNPRHFIYVSLALITVALFAVILPLIMTSKKPAKARRQLFEVRKVIDGDTIELENGQTVRLIGIDAPEIETASCFSQEAKDKTQSLLQGKSVELEKDVSDKDQFERLLRYVYLDGVLVNKLLVEEGYAQTVNAAPDVKFEETLTQSEREARRQGRGIWSSCQITFLSPEVLGIEATSSARL